MHYILMDDNAAALVTLMQSLGRSNLMGRFVAAKIDVIWANTRTMSLTGFSDAKSSLSGKGITVTLFQAKSQQDVVDKLNQIYANSSPTVLCSDLNMNPIGLITLGDDGWQDPTNVVRLAVQKFAADKERLVCLHSNSGNNGVIADQMGGVSAKIFPLSHNFDGNATSDQADRVAKELAECIALADRSPFEKIWSDKEAGKWFCEPRDPRHDWTGFASTEYRKRVSSVLRNAFPAEVPGIQEGFWNETFHEAVKGIVGGTFCGSDYGSKGKPLRLGGVVFAATMAYAVERRTFGPFEHVWTDLGTSIRDRSFLGHTSSLDTRVTCVGLWWLFRRLFQADRHKGDVLEVKMLAEGDGVEIVFNWSTKLLFEAAKEKAKAATATLSVGRAHSIPANSTDALAMVLAALSFEPGRILPCHYGIRIQAVAVA